MYNFVLNIPAPISNKGDEAIAKCMIESINKSYHNSKISIICSDPEKERKFFQQFSVDVYGRLFSTKNKVRSRAFLSIEFFIKTLWYLVWTKIKFLPIDKNAKTFFNLIEKSDLIIFGGGGYLGGAYRSIQDILIPILLTKKLQKKIYLSSISIEYPKNYFIKKLIRFVLNQVDLITTREPISYKVLESLNIKSKKYNTSDFVLLMENKPKEIGLELLRKSGVPDTDTLKIGVSLKHWNVELIGVKNLEVPFNRLKSYQDNMKESIEMILSKTNATIFLFVFDTQSISDDRIISNYIKKNIKKSLSDRIFIVNEDLNSEQLKSIIGAMDIFIGTRFHSTIFSLSMYVPTISIAYMQKNKGFMEAMDLQKWVMDFSTFTSKDLVDTTLKLLSEREKVINKLREKIPEIQEKASQNVDLIDDLLSMPKKAEKVEDVC